MLRWPLKHCILFLYRHPLDGMCTVEWELRAGTAEAGGDWWQSEWWYEGRWWRVVVTGSR